MAACTIPHAWLVGMVVELVIIIVLVILLVRHANTTLTVTITISEAECIKRACKALYDVNTPAEQYGPAKHIVAVIEKTLEDMKYS
jgi:ATP-dependent protease HslVU (ClpYQ) ATPase subunit